MPNKRCPRQDVADKSIRGVSALCELGLRSELNVRGGEHPEVFHPPTSASGDEANSSCAVKGCCNMQLARAVHRAREAGLAGLGREPVRSLADLFWSPIGVLGSLADGHGVEQLKSTDASLAPNYHGPDVTIRTRSHMILFARDRGSNYRPSSFRCFSCSADLRKYNRRHGLPQDCSTSQSSLPRGR
jgi:hypothetical protein